MNQIDAISIDKLNQKVNKLNDDEKSLFGFWLYILTDCVLFATLFATYAVLRLNTFNGPNGQALFKPPYVLAETIVLLSSSFLCGLGWLSMRNNDKKRTIFFFSLTFLLGLVFLILEIREFDSFIMMGDSFRRSGFLSAYFTLVATHGLHITVGLIWIAVMIMQVLFKGLSRSVKRRLTMLSLFWHFLDIVWIFIFTIVYMLGVSHG